MTGTDQLLTTDRLVLATGSVEPGWVRTSGDRIVGAGAGAPDAPAHRHLDGILAPGFVDAHCHGGGGSSFTTGDAGSAATVIATHRAHGTTSLVASLVTDRTDRLEECVRALAPLVHSGELAGLHLEGPWLSARHCGAHDPGLLRAPVADEVARLLHAGGGSVRMVTLAPELEGGLEAVAALAADDVVAALGHSDATWTQAVAALDAGVTVGTHLFNAMPPLHHREPGAVLALLQDPRAAVELVADGVHLHPEVLRFAAGSAPHRFLLVTDAMSAAGSADGDYVLGPVEVHVRDGVARLASSGAIAGSTLTMDGAVRFAVHEARLPLDEVIEAVTATPARVLGLADVGAIEPGRLADLVHLDEGLQVRAVMRRGSWLSGPS